MNDQVSLICVCDKLPFSCSIQYNLNENSRLIEGAIMAQNLTYTQCYASKTRLPQNDDKQTRYPHKYVYALKSESLLIHPKILTRKSESVLIHSLRWPAKSYNCITKITIRRFHGTLYWIQNSFAKGRKTVCVQN